MKFLLRCFLFSFSCLLIFSSCRKTVIDNSSSVKLGFSADTVKFDTVFTTIGSASRIFKVYNHDSKSIKISSITLANGSKSFFRLNVDGKPGNSFSNVEINGEDSMYVYVAVTVDPTNENNPFVALDSILFNINGNRQHVVLSAYGQNAYFHYGEIFKTTTPAWKNDKPHVIINSFLVDSFATLNIPAGTRIYMHGNSGFFVNGTVIANGTKQDSIVFQGDRLEQFYVGLPGNWGYIRFLKPSKDNVFTHVIIKDGTDGVIVDSLSVDANPKLTMSKCMIRNMTDAGIQSGTGSIKATNCLIYNCGNYCAELYFGGQYNFTFCTFADYSNIAINHQLPSVAVTNYFVQNNTVYIQDFSSPLPNFANFTNCIIYGGLDNELLVDSAAGAKPLHYQFTNNDIKSNKSLGNFFTNCEQNNDPLFADYTNDNLSLNTSPPSPCIGQGASGTNINDDYTDASRNTNNPSIGCYEK